MSDPTTTRIVQLDATPAFTGRGMKAAAGFLIVLGLGTFLATLLLLDEPGDGHRGLPIAWSGVLAGTMIPLWIAIGALFFTAVHVLGGARWTIPFRRVSDGLTSGLVATVIGCGLIMILGGDALYAWINNGSYQTPGQSSEQAHAAHLALFHAVDGSKAAWMSWGRWAITGLIILALYLLLRGGLVGMSLRRDAGLDPAAGEARWSVAVLVLGGFAFTLFTIDWLLALDVNHVSAIFGMYCLGGAVQTFLGVLVLCLIAFSRRGQPLHQVVREHTRKDLGTWMLAWGCIVAYLTFVQFVIIWFPAMDEDSAAIVKRMQHGYGAWYVAEAVLRSAVPFVLLMSLRLRAHPLALAVAAAAVLIGNWLDLAWWILPTFTPNDARSLIGPELLIAGTFVGGFLLLAAAFWRKHGLVPRDPRLLPAINGDHLH